jgi:membrane protease YdiL (CAAX protease family)
MSKSVHVIPDAIPSASDFAATSGPSWLLCLAVVSATAVIVAIGHGAAQVLAPAISIWFRGMNPMFGQLSGPIVSAVYQLAFVWIFAAWVTRTTRRDALSLTWPTLRAWQWLAIVIGLYAVKAGASIVIIWLTKPNVAVDASKAAAGGVIESLSPFAAVMRSPAWMLLLLGGILAAIVEELLFRGFLSRTLEQSALGFWGGATVASLIWAGLHAYYPLGLQAVLVVCGVCLSLVRARTGSVYPGMLWHVCNNTVGLLAMRYLV